MEINTLICALYLTKLFRASNEMVEMGERHFPHHFLLQHIQKYQLTELSWQFKYQVIPAISEHGRI